MVAGRDARHPGAHRLDDARALVPEHDRAAGLGRPVDRVVVRAADTARAEADEHLLRPAAERGRAPAPVSGPPVASRTAARIFTRSLPPAPAACSRAQLVERDVAAHQVVRLDLDERRLGLVADRAEPTGAARVEDAAARGLGRARDVALEPDALAPAAVDRRHGREERLGVRVVRPVEDDVGRARAPSARPR